MAEQFCKEFSYAAWRIRTKGNGFPFSNADKYHGHSVYKRCLTVVATARNDGTFKKWNVEKWGNVRCQWDEEMGYYYTQRD